MVLLLLMMHLILLLLLIIHSFHGFKTFIPKLNSIKFHLHLLVCFCILSYTAPYIGIHSFIPFTGNCQTPYSFAFGHLFLCAFDIHCLSFSSCCICLFCRLRSRSTLPPCCWVGFGFGLVRCGVVAFLRLLRLFWPAILLPTFHCLFYHPFVR